MDNANTTVRLVTKDGQVVYPHETVLRHAHTGVAYVMNAWECDEKGRNAVVFAIPRGSRFSTTLPAKDLGLKVQQVTP